MNESIEQLQKMQSEFEKKMNKQMTGFVETVMSTVNQDASSTSRQDKAPDVDAAPLPSSTLLKEVQRMQTEFEKGVQKQLAGVIETVMNTSEQQAPSSNTQNTDFGVVDETDAAAEVSQLIERVEELEGMGLLAYQLPIAFRYRNDGADGVGDGIHRLEFILRTSPYKNGKNGALWDNADWVAISGADAEIYTA